MSANTGIAPGASTERRCQPPPNSSIDVVVPFPIELERLEQLVEFRIPLLH